MYPNNTHSEQWHAQTLQASQVVLTKGMETIGKKVSEKDFGLDVIPESSRALLLLFLIFSLQKSITIPFVLLMLLQ